MDADGRWIEERSKKSLNPPQVENILLELSRKWVATERSLADVIENFPLGPDALVHLLAISTICGSRLVQAPDILLWLARPEISLAPRDMAEMLTALHNLAGDAVGTDNFAPLRVWKNREMVRIALREVADVAPLEETTAELSQIAEISIRRVVEHWDQELRQRHGAPNAEFAVLALGKLGGGELNHSSDVDLIFLYSEEGQLSPHFSYHEFFNRLAEKILTTFNSTHPQGSLFRLDLRLRPEGTAGPLARSLRSMEYYYSGYGETWERLALIKARGVAGSRELAYDFLRQHQPFIYPKIATPDLLEQIGNIKQRIEQDVVGADKLFRDVKLGRGGIREIEFVVQTLQFIHGARHAFLQDTSTLRALRALAQLELIPQPEVVALDRAYRFLRRTEHRLQIEAEQQTHTVPANSDHLRRIAASLGFASPGEFKTALDREMASVHELFERLVTGAPTHKTRENITVFANEPAAQRALSELEHGSRGTHVSARTRQLSRKLRPLLLDALAGAADPDATLNHFVRFADAYGMRSMLFELLVVNPRLLELLVKAFDASRFAADLLVRHPAWLEEVTRSGKLNEAVDCATHLQQLRALNSTDIEMLRTYRHAELLRILLRDVLQLADQQTVLAEQTDLAEACLVFLNDVVGSTDLTIVGLGKFGGRDLSYGADLDVLFVGDDSAAAQKLLAAAAQPSAHGSLPRLDARLRPEGEKGPLVVSLETFARYHETRGQFWEAQALTRARPVTGPLQEEFTELARAVWRRAGEQPDAVESVDNMLLRIRRDRGSGSEFRDFKTGTGGIIEAEFLIQALQMTTNLWEPNWMKATDRLVEAGHLAESDAVDLREAYRFLRQCESVRRRYDISAVSALPSDADEHRTLVKRMQLQGMERFTQKYLEARLAVHRLYTRRLRRERSAGAEELEKLLQDEKADDHSGDDNDKKDAEDAADK